MSIFQSKIPPKPVVISRHPWESRIKAKYSNSFKHAHNSVNNPIYPVPRTGNTQERPEENNKNKRIKFTVIGNRVTKEFIYCLYLVKGLHKTKQKWFETPVIRGVTGVEWPKVWNDLKLQFGGPVYCLKSQVAVLKNEEFLGGESELKAFVEDKYVYNVYLDYHKEGIQQFANFIKSSGRPCVYMHISIGNEPAGCLIFMLYVDVAPLTCQNFMKMCHITRGGYSGSPIHRIVQDCWIQCGGFILKNSDPILCENYIVPHDRRGVLSMANNGRHIDCSTQFFVLLQPAPWMNNKYVAFGQLIEGEGTLSKIESVATWYESPLSDIVIDSAGILNLECQRIPINRGVIEYIERHTEDLVAVGRFFFELILDKVFNVIKFKILERLAKIESGEIEEEEKPVRKAERAMRKKEEQQDDVQNFSDENTINNDFDVDEYEYEDIMYIHEPITPVPSSVPTPTELYYLPLTDVPYPGEVDSIYDLKKFLRGDYCLESDLKKASSTSVDKPFLYKIPQTTVDTLFDYLTIDLDMSDTSLNQEDEDIVKLYLLENNDTVSFAGRIVTQMANFSEKLRLFDGTITKKSNRDVLADEDLRLIGLVHKELTTTRKKNVSLSVPESQLPRGLIRRRQTGYVHPEDVAYLLGESSEQVDEDDDDEEENHPSTDAARHVSTSMSHDKDNRVHLLYPGDSGSFYSKSSQKIQDDMRKVKIASLTNLQHIPNRVSNLRSNLDFEDEHDVRRTSLLQRLYDEIDANGDDNVAPTLKNYKPMTETRTKSFMLTNSHFDIPPDNEREKYLRHVNAEEDNSIDHLLQLQHGKKVFRKISSDYVRTIDQFEQLPANSIRSIEYSKKRPAITVDQYQKMNREHEEQMKTTQDKMTDTEDPQNNNFRTNIVNTPSMTNMDRNQIKHTNHQQTKPDHNPVAIPKHPIKPVAIETQKTLDERVKFTVIGNRVTKEFIYCMYLVDKLCKYRKEQFKTPSIHSLTGIEWPKVWNDLKNRFGPLAHCIKSEVAVLIDDKLLGGENELKKVVESKYVYNLRLDYYNEGIQQFANYIKSHGRPCAYLNISINDNPTGTLIFMLYIDIVPQTCQNFLEMCQATKNGYNGTPIHRIVKDCWIQCGGFDLKSHNELNCENFRVPHDRRGVLCMANNGRDIECSTQFFVLLQPATWMKNKYVAFGQLIEGEKTLKCIEEVPTWYESPEADIKIYKAGVFDMDYHNIPVNKQACAYLNSHVEDLATVGEFFHKIILENVFTAVDKKRTKPKKNLEDIDVRPAKRFMVKNEESEHIELVSDTSRSYSDLTVNIDADDIYEYEFETDTHHEEIATENMYSTVVKPKKPFYIPLTDVPYPGEVDSSFDLKKLLRGDYCLESDLEHDPVKRKQVRQISEEKPFRELSECCGKSDDDWEFYLSVEDEEKIKKYLRDNLDTVSFAGPYVKKIARDKLNTLLMEESKDSSSSSNATTNLTFDETSSKLSSNSTNVEESNHNSPSLASSEKSSSSKIRPSLTVLEYQMRGMIWSNFIETCTDSSTSHDLQHS